MSDNDKRRADDEDQQATEEPFLNECGGAYRRVYRRHRSGRRRKFRASLHNGNPRCGVPCHKPTSYELRAGQSKAPAMQSKVTLAVPNGVRAAGTTAPAVAREPLLQQQRQRQDAAAAPADAGARDAGGGDGSFPWLPAAGFAYLTFSSGMALHRCWPDRGDAAFIVSAYADLVLLFCCLRRYERAEAGSSRREWLKLAVWLLTSALTLLFSYKVAAVMPAAVAAVVWLMGLATICGGFLAFFCFQNKT